MQAEHMQVLSSLMDGDTVDPDELAAALEWPEGRRVLVDFVRLRRAVQEDEAVPASMEALRRHVATRRPAQRPARLAAAAALLALAAYGAFDLGRVVRGRAGAGPPAATREIAFEPGVDWAPVNGGTP